MGNRRLAHVTAASYNSVMLRETAVVLVGTLLATATADAAPPPLRALDVRTVYGLVEGARKIGREQRAETQPTTLPTEPVRQKLRMKVIVIDPGHGGSNEGAIGVAGIREKLLTMELAYQLRDAIEKRHPDVIVVMTRYWDRDVDLYERTRWANRVGADLFVSLHYNAASHDRALGFETYFLSEETMATVAVMGDRRKQQSSKVEKRAFRAVDTARVRADARTHKLLEPAYERSKKFADLVETELARQLDAPDRGVKQANFAVLRGARMPAVVVESGFLTHPIEGLAVATDVHRAHVVAALLAAIEAFDKTLPPKKPKKPVARNTP